MRASRKKQKKAGLVNNKPPGQATPLKKLENGINLEDFSRFENEGGSNGSSLGVLPVEVPSQPDKPIEIPPI